jgi:hypothetical protein
MTRNTAVLCFLALAPFYVFGQNGSGPSGLMPSVTTPTLNARLTIGFNYDLLRAPTDVSFDYAKGNAGVNFPLEQSGLIPKQTSDKVWAQMSQQISTDSSSGAQFEPHASARQYANTTIRVDVPMLGGVASFSNIQNVYLNYMNMLGNSTVRIRYDTTMNDPTGAQRLSLLLLGSVNVPIEATLGWETMTFGYAYRVNKNLIAAMNIHRHLFRIDLLANVDAELLGNGSYERTTPTSSQSVSGGIAGLGGDALSIKYPINYSQLGGYASGHYEAEAWSYSLGLVLWRFTLTSRFGIDTKAKGSFTAHYAVPSGIMDPRTFQVKADLQSDPNSMLPLVNNISAGKVDTVSYSSTEDATWKLPSGHTLAFDIIRNKLSVSYTKLFGDIEMFHAHEERLSTGETKRTVDLDMGITIDNIVLLNAHLYTAFLNIGLFTMDIRLNDQQHILGKAYSEAKLDNLKWGNAAMLPILNFGASLGSKTQLGFEVDLLPLPAFKTGVTYNF